MLRIVVIECDTLVEIMWNNVVAKVGASSMMLRCLPNLCSDPTV